jgi:hypothetical protein
MVPMIGPQLSSQNHFVVSTYFAPSSSAVFF